MAQLGVGLVMNQNISIRPSVDLPLKSGNDTRFGLTVGYNFGSKGARLAGAKQHQPSSATGAASAAPVSFCTPPPPPRRPSSPGRT